MKKMMMILLMVSLLFGMAMLSARAEETAALTPAEKGYTSVAGNDYRTANGPAPANMLEMYNDDSTLSGVKARFTTAPWAL
ncbi:MAG: hypothetical protein IJB69_10115 [Clostridia bacterium]|nr:hypothetical protein [Clostridia bacterium]